MESKRVGQSKEDSCFSSGKGLLGMNIQDVFRARWSERLPTLLQAYNNTLHSSAGAPPCFVMRWLGSFLGCQLNGLTEASLEEQRHDPEGWVRFHP